MNKCTMVVDYIHYCTGVGYVRSSFCDNLYTNILAENILKPQVGSQKDTHKTFATN